MLKRLFILIPIIIILLSILPPASARAQNQLVRNGTFDSGLTYWNTGVITGKGGYPVIRVENNFQGDPSLYIDAPIGTDGYAEQTIAVPNSPNVVLMFYTWGNHDPVTITISIISAGGGQTTLDRFDPSCKIDKGCRSPELKQYDISSFSGQTITLRFRVASDYGTGTFGWFDDVQVLASTPPEPTQYSLTIRTSGCGDTDPGEGTHYYDDGTRVTIYADPCRDWEFDRWSGDASGTSSPTTITMNSNKSVTAHFEEISKEEKLTAEIISIEPNRAYQDDWVHFVGNYMPTSKRIVYCAWKSNKDGILASDNKFISQFSELGLSVGEHKITLVIRDSDGATAEATEKLVMEKTTSFHLGQVERASLENPARNWPNGGITLSEGESVYFEFGYDGSFGDFDPEFDVGPFTVWEMSKVFCDDKEVIAFVEPVRVSAGAWGNIKFVKPWETICGYGQHKIRFKLKFISAWFLDNRDVVYWVIGDIH